MHVELASKRNGDQDAGVEIAELAVLSREGMLVIVLEAEAKLDRHGERRLAFGHRPAWSDAELEIRTFSAAGEMPAIRLAAVIAAKFECQQRIRRDFARVRHFEADFLDRRKHVVR